MLGQIVVVFCANIRNGNNTISHETKHRRTVWQRSVLELLLRNSDCEQLRISTDDVRSKEYCEFGIFDVSFAITFRLIRWTRSEGRASLTRFDAIGVVLRLSTPRKWSVDRVTRRPSESYFSGLGQAAAPEP